MGQAAGLIVEDCDTILFSNTDQTTTVTLPVGAKIHVIEVYVATTFDGSGTDLLDIGITGSGNRYEDNLDLASEKRNHPQKWCWWRRRSWKL